MSYQNENFLKDMEYENKSISDKSLGEALLEKYFGKDKELFDQITMEEEEHLGSLKENQGPLSQRIQEKIENLNRFLLAIGYTPKQIIQQDGGQEVALESAIQLIYELIQREQRQKKQQEELLLSCQQWETKYKNARQCIEKLERKLEEQDKQHSTTKLKDERQIRALEQQLQKWIEECTEWKIKTANWEQLQVQFGYELKKKDKDYQRLQQRLQQIMQEQSRKVVKPTNGDQIACLFGRKQQSTEREDFYVEDLLKEETYRMMESSFQDRIQKLQKENTFLQSFIYEMYHKIVEQLDKSVNPPNNSRTSDQFSQNNPLHYKLDLPFETAKDDIQKLFDEKLQQLFSMCSLGISEEEMEHSSNTFIANNNNTTHFDNTSTSIVHSKDMMKEPTTPSSNEALRERAIHSYHRGEASETSQYDLDDSRTTSMPTLENCILEEEEANLDDYL